MEVLKLEDLISENKEIFKQELEAAIKPNFDGLNNPTKYAKIVKDIITKCDRLAFPRQARLVAAASEFISNKKNKSLIISAEMGTGKTDMAAKIAISIAEKFKINFIMCPPHLVDKWEDEIDLNFKDKKSYKVVKIAKVADISPYTNRAMHLEKIQYFFIISRENAKLSYPKVMVFKEKKSLIKREIELDGQKTIVSDFETILVCPDCNSDLFAVEKENIKLKAENKSEKGEVFVEVSAEDQLSKFKECIPYKCKCGSVLRDVDKTKSPNLQKRLSISEYIKRTWTKGSIDLLIVDEMHEYKGGNTGQGNSFAQLVSVAKKTIGLTGTLLNGYASSIFYILYRINPTLMHKKLKYEYQSVSRFIRDYGAYEETYKAKEVNNEGVVTKKGRKVGSPREKPKISPMLLSILLEMTIFLRLDEIKIEGKGLPNYDEEVILVPMEEDIKADYMKYITAISEKISGDNRFLGNLANDAISVPDMPFQKHNAQKEIFYNPRYTREEFEEQFGYLNKEKKLIERIKEGFDNGDKCLIYVHFSGKGIAQSLEDICNKEFSNKIVKFLPVSVEAKKRQQWIKDNPCDILICNPELVKTGLDLLEFPLIIFYETTYNVFTLKQASRRSWRLGQAKDVKVVFIASKDTPQHKALELIGAKIAAANSLEGRLSGDDDLSSMGDGDDNIQLALAKSIMSSESSSENIEMTSIKNFGGDRDWDNFELYYRSMIEKLNTSEYSIEDLEKEKREAMGNVIELTFINEEVIEHEDDESFVSNEIPIFNSLLDYNGEITSNYAYQYKTKKVNGKKVSERIKIDLNDVSSLENNTQLSLF